MSQADMGIYIQTAFNEVIRQIIIVLYLELVEETSLLSLHMYTFYHQRQVNLSMFQCHTTFT